MTQPRITFAYSYASDLVAVRAFYEGLLGLPVTAYYEDSFIEFDAGVKLVFMHTEAGQEPLAAIFSSLPGWQGGAGQRALCSMECSKPQLDALRDRLFLAGVDFTELKLRDGAWELRALDPMGNTVELYAIEAA